MHLALLSLALVPALVASSPEPASQCPLPQRPRIVQMLMLIDRSGSLGWPQKRQLQEAVNKLAKDGGFERASQGCELYYSVRGFFSLPLASGSADKAACEDKNLIHWVPDKPSWTLLGTRPQLPEAVKSAASDNLKVDGRVISDSETDTPLLPLLTWADEYFDEVNGLPVMQDALRARLLLIVSDTKAECHVGTNKCKKNPADERSRSSELESAAVEQWKKTTKNYQQVYVLKFKGDKRQGHDELYQRFDIGRRDVDRIHGYEFGNTNGEGNPSAEKIVAQIADDINAALRAACRAAVPECCCNNLDDNGNGFVDEGCCCDRAPQEEGFPEVVAVGRGGRFHCSGAVVDERAVLTARHCLPVDAVLLGESLDGVVQRRRVRGVSVPSDDKLDVAMLELDEPVLVPLRQRRGPEDDSPPASLLTHVGFGSRDSAGAYGFGVKHSLLLDSQGWGCTREQALRLGCDPDNEMFVPGSPGRDTCRGDSGGPLYEQSLYEPVCRDGPDPSAYRTQWRLVGITSRSAEGGRVACGEGGIYVRADRIAPWLDATLKDIRRRATPGRKAEP